MNRTSVFYLLVILIAGGGILGVLRLGANLPSPVAAVSAGQARSSSVVIATDSRGDEASPIGAMVAGLKANVHHPLSHLFIQLLVIIVAARLMGGLFAKFGQPSVIGEMMAGILLGPSLIGWAAPEFFQFVFPPASVGTLKLLSQIGVCLFMFVVGMELDMKHVRNKAHTAVVVSHASIIAPYFLGVVLAYFLYSSLAQPGTNFLAFALFMGISMSITAFPVLARILQERNMTQTDLGSTAITCAAVDDVTAWSALAFVVAITGAQSLVGSAMNLGLVVVFIAVMIWGIRPLLAKTLGEAEIDRPAPSRRTLAIVVCMVLASSLCTEAMGIHALFGAFLAGAIVPDRSGFREKLSLRIENFSTVLLLPLFFAFTGLRTQVGLLNDFSGWLICLAIIAVATLGKLGGSALTARFTGMNWRDSLQLGALMNTRGLMELIALNIGYDLGILSPRIFAMLVIMALVTTAMTGPLLTWFGKIQVREKSEPVTLSRGRFDEVSLLCRSKQLDLAQTSGMGTLPPVNSAPLGIFDSGVGGLTVVRAVQELLPNEDILYLGDTARLPYGSKSPETIRHFADEDVRFLISKGVKAVVVACNTATAHALPQLLEQYRIPILGVIEPGVEAALEDPEASRIGIIATRGTIRSHAYQHALALRRTGLIIHGEATPLLVPFIEENWIDHPATRQVLEAYLNPLIDKGIDTLMLACTHYPLLIPVLKELLPPDVRLVDSATTCAEHLKRELTRLDLLTGEEGAGKLELHLTDLSEQFEELARRFLKKSPGRIWRAVLGV